MMCCGSLFQILGQYTENDLSAKETQWVLGPTKCGEQEADDRSRCCLELIWSSPWFRQELVSSML